MEALIRRRVLRRLIWVCTVCLCPTKRTLGIYGLVETPFLFTIFDKKIKSDKNIVKYIIVSAEN